MTDTITLDWNPIETAPHQQVIWVRNRSMEKPLLATRGHMADGMVLGDPQACTSEFTPDEGLPFPAGRLIIATEWAPYEEEF